MTTGRAMRILGSPRLGLMLAVLVMGLNAAYLLRHGSGAILWMTFILLGTAAAAIVARASAEGSEERGGSQHEAPTSWNYIMNGMMAAVLVLSIQGIF